LGRKQEDNLWLDIQLLQVIRGEAAEIFSLVKIDGERRRCSPGGRSV